MSKKCWSVRLKNTINPSKGLVKGMTLQVITPAESHDYPTLRKTLLAAGYDVNNSGGWESDSWWEWTAL